MALPQWPWASIRQGRASLNSAKNEVGRHVQRAHIDPLPRWRSLPWVCHDRRCLLVVRPVQGGPKPSLHKVTHWAEAQDTDQKIFDGRLWLPRCSWRSLWRQIASPSSWCFPETTCPFVQRFSGRWSSMQSWLRCRFVRRFSRLWTSAESLERLFPFWQWQPGSLKRLNMLGRRNLGCICSMNAALRQLFYLGHSVTGFWWPISKTRPIIPFNIFFQPLYRCEAPIGGTLLYKKQLGVFLQIFNILRKIGEINFKIGGIGQVFVLFYIA
jgi:hypothetical protein